VNVLLVSARRSVYSGEAISAPHQGLLSIAAVLREGTFHDTRGTQVTILDDQLYIIDRPWMPPSTYLQGQNPDIIGVQTLASSMKNGIRLLEEARQKNPKALTVMGGVGPTPEARRLIVEGATDVVVRGEGEVAFSALVYEYGNRGRAGLATVPGIVYRDEDGNVRENPPVAQIQDLDQLPLPARDLVDMQLYRKVSRGRAGNLMTSRGCAYACAYCYSRHQWGIGQRRQSVARVIEEIGILFHQYGIDRIRIEDDDFVDDEPWVREFCDEMVRTGYNELVEWEAKSRPDHLNIEMTNRLRRAGCFRLLVGVETLNPQLLRVMSRPLQIEVLERGMEALAAANIAMQATLILGIPGEPDEAMRHTITWLHERLGKNRQDIVSPCFFVPFHDEITKAMTRRLQFKIEVKDTDCYTGHIPVTSSDACSYEELLALYEDMEPTRRGIYKRIAHLAPIEEVQRRLQPSETERVAVS
jgi:methyltransferase